MAPGLLCTLLALVLWDAHYEFASAAPVVSGTAYGFATGTTGGGDAKPVYPKTTKELETYLGDAEPRVIVLNKEFTFLKAEGSTTEQGCRPPSKDQCLAKKNGFEAQDYICVNVISPSKEKGGCGVDDTPTQVTYDKAAITPLMVASDKTLVGEGLKGVVNGKSFHIFGSNVIVQNIHITNLNPHLVWGGDAITIRAKNGDAPKGIWIDHIKVSNVGRQMLVTGHSGGTGITVSNSDFDGRSKFSASCDGHHYWTILLYGKKTELSLLGNYINHTSGRSPRVGGGNGETTVLHAANNFFNSNSGHAFDVTQGGYVLAEGNYFSKVKIPATEESKHLFVPTAANDCKAVIGRACSMNVLKDSGPLKGCSGGEVSSQFASLKKYITSYKAGPATSFKEASGNFGVGELGDAVAQPGAPKKSGVPVSSSDASEGGEDVENSVTQNDILTGSSSSDKSVSHNPSAGGPSTPGSDNTEAPVSEEKTGGQADKNADDDSEESDKEGSDGSSHLRKNEGDANSWQPDKKADEDWKKSGKEGGEDVENSVTQDDILTGSSSSDKSVSHNPSAGGPSTPGSDASKSMDNTEAPVSEDKTGGQADKTIDFSPGTVAPDHQSPADAKKPVNGQDEHHGNSQSKDESHEDKSKSKDHEKGGADLPSSDASEGGEDMENSVTQDDILTGSSSSDKSVSHNPSAGGPSTPGSDNTEAPVSEEKTGGQADKNADDDSEESDKEGSDGSSHLRKNEGDANAWQPDKKADEDWKKSGKEGGEDVENSVTQDDILTGSSSSDKSVSHNPSAGGPSTPGSDASKSMDNSKAPVAEEKTGGQADKNADDDSEESDKEGSDGSSHLRKNEGDANSWQPDKKADDDPKESGKEGGGGSNNIQESRGDSNGWQANTNGNSYWQGSGKEGGSSARQANSVADSYWKAFGNDGGANSST
ncbi:unnamed protein product [Hyaloperonospora brassicae]|uniref:pectin lyase n=1 Tax=Hyaloperonospora brassicae TaxID=162125 RepID=A0AAV0TYK9_HYABA|nr:unnamed protein product [Hyaloperonospora brassicae]